MKTSLMPLVVFAALSTDALADPWPAWRGDLLGSGRTSDPDLPLEWGPEKNVRWRVKLPERGNSTPVVHGERLFVTQAVSDDDWRGLLCFNRKNGALLWKNGLTYHQEERTHQSNPYCSASPTTDGKIVVASYGSAGIAAYDVAGRELWRRNLGAIDHIWGNSSSPLLHGDLVIHYHGPADNAVLYGLDRASGETRWSWKEPAWKPGQRTDGFQGREEKGIIGAFSTPIIVPAGGRQELVMSFPTELKAFDPATGRELWTSGGLNPLIYSSPVFAEGIVIAMGGYKGNSIGVKAGGNGEVTGSHRLWQKVRHNGGIGTGVVRDGHYYYHNSGGKVFCDEIRTGETVWSERLPGSGRSWGSLVLAGERIYTLGQSGEMVVFKASTKGLEIIARSAIGEKTNSSPVPSGGDLFLRTHEALWCLGGT